MKELIEKIGKGTRKKTVKVLAGIVAFATAYSLILPAITIDEETAQEEPGMVLNENENTEEVLAEYEAPEEVVEQAPAEEPVIEETPAEEVKEETSAEEAAAEETVTEETAPAEITTQTPAEETNQEEPAEVEPEPVIVLEATAGKLEYEAKEDYKVTIEYTKDAGFTKETELEIRETLKEDEYANSLVKAQKEFEEEEIAQARFFETVFLAEGEEFKTAKGKIVATYEPEKMEIEENQEITVLTTDKEGEYEEVDEKKLSVKEKDNKVEEIKFETEDLESFTILVLEKDAEEEAAETPAAEEAPVEETPAMPAASFAKTAGDVTVTVEAPEGAFPEGTQMEIELVDENQYIDAINEAIDENEQVKTAQAVDIRFIYNNEEIEPKKEIKVNLISNVIKQTDDPKLIHIDNEGSASVVEATPETKTYSEEINNPSKSESVESLTFTSGEFSVYVIVGTESITVPFVASDGRTYEVSVSYSNEAGIPDGSILKVEEVKESNAEYSDYVEKTADFIGRETEDITYIKLLDISIVDENNNKVSLSAPVSVQIRLMDVDQAEESTQVVHFGKETTDVIDPEIIGDTVSFETDGFSIYAVVDSGVSGENARLKIEFKNGDSVIKTMYVKKADVDQGTLEQVLYDPGVPTSEHKKFMGWTDSSSYSAATEGKTIQTIRSEVTQLFNGGVNEGDSITYHAMMFTSYELYYQDEHEITFKTENLLSTETSATTTVNTPYSVEDSATMGFIGWIVKGSDGSTVYRNGSTITLTEDTILVPKIGEGYWLHFDENDGGSGTGNATYTPPAFVPAGETTAAYEPDKAPTRPGYEFDGWYTAATGGELFDFDTTTLTGPTTLYAHWTPKAEAQYKVIIWKQKVTDDKNASDEDKTYDYLESHQFTAATDMPITESLISQYLNYGNSELGVTDLDHGSYGFKKPARWEVINGTGADENGVSADSSTVVNVYYDRAPMTIIFDNNPVVIVDKDGNATTVPAEVTYIPSEGKESGVYGLIDGNYVLLDVTAEKRIQWSIYKKNGTITMPDSITQVKLSSNSGWPQDPSTVTVDSLNLLSNAIGSTSTQANGKYIYTTNSSGNNYIRLRWTIAGDYSYSYNGEPYTGQVYEKVNKVTYTGLYGQDFAQYGYKWALPGANGKWNNVSFLSSFTGNHFGHPNEGNTPNMIVLTKDSSVPNTTIIFYVQDSDDSALYYEADRARYYIATDGNFNITERFTGVESAGYKWSTSASMPTSWDTGISNTGYTSITRGNNTYLHIRYNLVKNDIVFMNGTDELNRIEDIPYGRNLSAYASLTPDPTTLAIPENYYFAGWYEDPEGVNPVDWSGTMPLGNKTIYAKLAPVEYHVIVNLNGGEIDPNQSTNFWVPYETVLDDTYFTQVTKTVGDDTYSLVGWYTDEELTQPWIFTTRITGDSLSVVYDGPDDERRQEYGDAGWDNTVGVFTLYAKWRNDSIATSGGIKIKYVNAEGASEYEYVDPLRYADLADVIAAQAPVEDYWPTGKQFAGWSLGDNTYSPGQTFEADSSLAERVQEEDPETHEMITRYVITLTAVYRDAEDRTPTHIHWYKNDGSGETYREDDDLGINESVYVYGYDHETGTVTVPTRTGYTFLGWAKDTEREEDSETINTSSTKTDLFITYDAEAHSYDVTQVAADEVMPYEGLYAVWQLNTQKVKIYKHETGNVSKALDNAEFSLTGPEGSEISYTGLKTNSDGYLVFDDTEGTIIADLPLGAYILTETTPPPGYNLIAQEIAFTVTPDGVTGNGSGYSTVPETETSDEEEVPTGVYVVKVANSAGVELPSTGGPGTLLYTLSGLALMLVAALMYGFRMRRRERRLQ